MITKADIHSDDQPCLQTWPIKGLPGYHIWGKKVIGPSGEVLRLKSNGKYMVYKDGIGMYKSFFDLKSLISKKKRQPDMSKLMRSS